MPRRLAAAACTVITLSTASACLVGTPDQARDPVAAPTSAAESQTGPASSLSAAQARAALITEADLGGPWKPSEGAATWRDGMLKATTNAAPDCRRLLEALYTEELLGPSQGGPALTALDDGDDQAQLHYEVAAHRPADVDRTLAWLRTLPENCGEFQATTTGAGDEGVSVTELPLPAVGNARQGLRVTLTGEAGPDGEQAVLTLDVAAVRVADQAILLTDGALGSVPSDDTTRRALEVGAQRLSRIREQGRAQA